MLWEDQWARGNDLELDHEFGVGIDMLSLASSLITIIKRNEVFPSKPNIEPSPIVVYFKAYYFSYTSSRMM